MVHCWSGNSNVGWYPWLQKHLENNGVEVVALNMPNPDTPSIDEWVDTLSSSISILDEETYFVGHSIGCQTILRYLEKQELTNIGGILFVTPWFSLLPERMDEESNIIASPWIETPIDMEKVKQFTNSKYAIFSTDDFYVSIEQATEFYKKLGFCCHFVENMGHMSFEDGIECVPEILLMCGKMLGFELLDEVDASGHPTGRVLDKEMMHDRGILHREVALFLINSKHEVLMERRSPNKRFNPNCWGLIAGHVDAFESINSAMLRELKEEVGLEATFDDLLLFDCILHQSSNRNSCLSYEYFMRCDKNIEDFVIQVEELSEVKWVPFEEFKEKSLREDETYTFRATKENIEKLEKLERLVY